MRAGGVGRFWICFAACRRCWCCCAGSSTRRTSSGSRCAEALLGVVRALGAAQPALGSQQGAGDDASRFISSRQRRCSGRRRSSCEAGTIAIVAGVCLGLLLVYICAGADVSLQRSSTDHRLLEAHRTEEMQAHGWHEGDFELQQYEQKLTNGEMVGFSASPNTLAAAMVLMSSWSRGWGFNGSSTRTNRG